MRTAAIVALTTWLIGWSAMASASAAQGKISWLSDWRQARDTAQDQQRLVLLHFYSDNCPPCRRLETHVFNRPEVIRAVGSGYIPVKINVDQHPELAKFYRVQQWPTDVIVAPNGREVSRSTPSPQDPNQYIALLDKVRAHHATGRDVPPQQQQQIASRPRRNDLAAFDMNHGQGYNSEEGGYQDVAAAGRQSWAGYEHRGDSHQGASAHGHSDYAAGPVPSANGFADGSHHGGQHAAPRGTDPSYAAEPGYGADGGYGAAPQGSYNGQTYADQTYAGQMQNSGGSQPGYGNQQPYAGQPGFGGPQGFEQQNAFDASQQPPYTSAQDGYGAPGTTPAQSDQESPRFTMDGYCPVTLVLMNEWAPGDLKWGATHQGRTYLFTSREYRDQFLADPGRFAPVLSGYDPVRFAESGQLVDGKRKHGVFYGNMIYLFADEASLNRFSKHPQLYVSQLRQAAQNQAGLVR